MVTASRPPFARVVALSPLVALVALGACLLSSETVSTPPVTIDGGAVSLQNVVDLVAAQQKAIATLEAKVQLLRDGNSPCPSDYTKGEDPPAGFLLDAIVCTRGVDEVVKVGTGSAAFWIDRYEASVWTTADGPPGGVQKFAPNDDTDAKLFPKNGQVVVPLFALSVKDKVPAVNITWFQALEACAASGKRLPTAQEWLRAVRGTFDPGANDGTKNTQCNTMTLPDKGTRRTGHALTDAAKNATTSCVSDWGAEDMIGNVWERTADWQAGTTDDAGTPGTPWPDLVGGDFHQDQVNNVSSSVYASESLGTKNGLPSVATLGGGVWSGVGAGVFAFDLRNSPTNSDWDSGFRCIVLH